MHCGNGWSIMALIPFITECLRFWWSMIVSLVRCCTHYQSIPWEHHPRTPLREHLMVLYGNEFNIAQWAALYFFPGPFLTIFSCCQGTSLWCFCFFSFILVYLYYFLRKCFTLKRGYLLCGGKSLNTLDDVLCCDDYHCWQRYNYTKEHSHRYHSCLFAIYIVY